MVFGRVVMRFIYTFTSTRSQRAGGECRWRIVEVRPVTNQCGSPLREAAVSSSDASIPLQHGIEGYRLGEPFDCLGALVFHAKRIRQPLLGLLTDQQVTAQILCQSLNP